MNGSRTLSADEFIHARAIPCPATGCWLWEGAVNHSGYGIFRFRRRTLRAHRAIWDWTQGPVPSGMLVCHRCDVPSCVNPDHLFLGTEADNVQDMMRKGRHRPPPKKTKPPPRPRVHPVGEMCTAAKLTEALVRQILLDTRTYKAIARDMSVSATTIGEIKRRQIWRHVDVAQ